MWEIFTGGDLPFGGRVNQDVLIERLTAGERLKIPEQTPKVVANCMEMCWKKLPEDRPTFAELLRILSDGDDQLRSIFMTISANSDPDTYIKSPA